MAEAAGGHRVKTIGPDGKLRVVEGMAPAKPESAAKIVADKLHVDYNDDGSNAQMKASDAGRIGGNLGGPMVRKMVHLARQEMANQHVESLIRATKK
ncbi:alpha/beta-type small acid-soluble spore protein [Alicyclobacillus fastidiosus]|uniref:Alpha/beta-type small acid-soluble spore protein n=1 Tax=Alicyclobacillus fastidiosus TaxID=392011 RepID=A0ABY6ZMF5_9BACL|nr:small, acid-soluble spore protein, alpha/beta type [Alicyclobacillus fastidiosus]WAH43773.1 alpha/beta-type small acid-soluble spore protein [Alicyclobacillus fastidiosus]